MIQTSSVLHTALTDLGLNASEIATYQAALNAGARPASKIARSAGINRAHAYEVLSLLTDKGLVEEVTKNGIKHFSSRPPEVVLEKLKSLASRIRGTRRQLEAQLPEILNSRSDSIGEFGAIQFYQGQSGFETAWNDVIDDCSSEVEVFLSTHSDLLCVENDSHRLRRKVFSRLGASKKEFKIVTERALVSHIKVPENIRFRIREHSDSVSDLIVYGDWITILNYLPKRRGLRLQNDAAANCLRSVHRLAWGLSSSGEERIFE